MTRPPWPFMSVDPRVVPQLAERRECNACDWTGPRSACVWLRGIDGGVGPLCPECRETTEAS